MQGNAKERVGAGDGSVLTLQSAQTTLMLLLCMPLLRTYLLSVFNSARIVVGSC